LCRLPPDEVLIARIGQAHAPSRAILQQQASASSGHVSDADTPQSEPVPPRRLERGLFVRDTVNSSSKSSPSYSAPARAERNPRAPATFETGMRSARITGAHAALVQDVLEIGREPVADVNHCVHPPAIAKPQAFFQRGANARCLPFRLPPSEPVT